jgi:DNA-binding LacI/PurR family transcriptional regulator
VVQLADIAREAKVSIATVSLALRNQPPISPATRERVQAVAAALGYQPNLFLSAHQSNVRKGAHQNYRGTIAWIDDTPEGQKKPSTTPQMLHGAQEQARAHGFSLDVIRVPYVHQSDDEANRIRLERILEARGIVGAIFPSLSRPCILEHDWKLVAVAAYAGNAGFLNGYDAACSGHLRYTQVGVDLYHDTRLALAHLYALGYRRIGFATSGFHETVASFRFTAARYAFSSEFPDVPFIKPCVDGWLAPEPSDEFRSWLRAARPDAVLTTLGCCRGWLKACGLEAPRNIGLAHPFLGPEEEGWSGVRENSALIGRALLDAVVAQILRGERGMASDPMSMQMIGRWEDGSTTRRLAG